jgi:hypothetical protein
MKCKILAAAVVAGLPSVALAQGFGHISSEFGLGYVTTDSTQTDQALDGMALSIRTDWALGGQFGVQFSGATRDFGLGNIQDLSLHGWYQVNDTVRLGLFGQQTATTLNAIASTLTNRMYGVEALLEPVENASIQIYASMGEVTADPGTLRFDHKGYGLSASFDFTPALTGRIGFDKATQDSSPEVSMSQMTIGADWHVNMGQLPMIVSFDYAQIDLTYEQSDRFSVTGKVLLGGKDGGKRRMFDTHFAPTFVYTF